jgi:hypothetical protein
MLFSCLKAIPSGQDHQGLVPGEAGELCVNSVRTVPTQPKLPVSNTEHAISKKRSRE